MLVAVVALAIVAVVAAVLMDVATAERRQLLLQERQTQAFWLAESGLERAAARLTDDPSYRGETWEISADQLRRAARVEIAVDPPAADGARKITATAEFPSDTAVPARCIRRTQLSLKNQTANRKEKS
jgi:type II secretory pathway pseudopilin PulG